MARRHAAMKVDHCIESCPLNGGVRTNVHDNLQTLWVVMLKAAGFQSVRLEDRSWDAEAPRSGKDRRRPNWTVGPYLPPDADAPADQVPETILFGSAQALFYACPPEPAPSVSTWMYPRIRFMQRSLEGDGAPARWHP